MLSLIVYTRYFATCHRDGNDGGQCRNLISLKVYLTYFKYNGMLQTKNICANGIKILRLALTISIMREGVLYMYGEYSRPYPAKETVSHKHVTLVSLHK